MIFYVARDFKALDVKDVRNAIFANKYELSTKELNYIGTKEVIGQKPWVVPRDCFGDGQLIQFEDDLFVAPNDCDLHLRTRCNNYMEMPEGKDRMKHKFLCFTGKE